MLTHVLPTLLGCESRCSYPQVGLAETAESCGRTPIHDFVCEGERISSTPTSSPGLRPHRASVNPVMLRDGLHADAALTGCSHSVHFLVCEPCSRSFLWFRRHPNQRVISLTVGVSIVARPSIPRGSELLNPWSSVPATLHCFHRSPQSDPRFRGEMPVGGTERGVVAVAALVRRARSSRRSRWRRSCRRARR